MKKFLTTLLAISVILAAICVMSAPVGADIVEGDWVTSRAADDYKDPESYRPACGYKYEADQGLVLVSADYTNNTPYTLVHTKQPFSVKEANADGNGNAISLQITVTDFAYAGESGSKDHFVAFSLHSQEVFAPGQTGYGEGVSVLIRGEGKGAAVAQFFLLDDSYGYKLFSMQNILIPQNDQGKEVYDFAVKYDGGKYKFYLCGTEFVDTTGLADAILDQYCDQGAYVGVSLYTGETGTNIGAVINKFQGMVPYGEDSGAPEDNMNNFADIVDSSTVEAGKPALIWNSAKEQFRDFAGSNLSFEVNEDGTIKTTAMNEDGFLLFSPLVSVSYEAADFPVIAILTRDCYADSGTIYYSAGDTFGAQPECSCEIDIAEYDYGEGWCMGILDLTGDLDWKGRVNMIRADFNNIEYTDEDMKSFDIAYLAAFRTMEDAEKYAQDYLIALLGELPEVTTKGTQAPESEDTTTAPEAETNDAENEQTTQAEQAQGGCGSVVAAPIIALVAALGAAFVTRKKN